MHSISCRDRAEKLRVSFIRGPRKGTLLNTPRQTTTFYKSILTGRPMAGCGPSDNFFCVRFQILYRTRSFNKVLLLAAFWGSTSHTHETKDTRTKITFLMNVKILPVKGCYKSTNFSSWAVLSIRLINNKSYCGDIFRDYVSCVTCPFSLNQSSVWSNCGIHLTTDWW